MNEEHLRISPVAIDVHDFKDTNHNPYQTMKRNSPYFVNILANTFTRQKK